MTKLYVTMTDSFLSGWGVAQDRKSKLIIECNGWSEAEAVESYARSRSEMKYVKIRTRAPRYNAKYIHAEYKDRESAPAFFKYAK